MADIVLEAKSPLNGLSVEHGGCVLRELTDIGLMSLAVPLGGDAPFDAMLEEQFGLQRPSAQISTHAADFRAVPLTPDQVLLMHPLAQTPLGISDAYTTDQTGNWCILSLSGAMSTECLARICPLDLSKPSFPVDAAARTVMEHMGALVIKTAPDAFVLLSASSSAQSFAHAVETSVRNVVGS